MAFKIDLLLTYIKIAILTLTLEIVPVGESLIGEERVSPVAH